MIVFCVILTLVCSLRACHMWLTRNHMFIREIWGKFTLFIFWNLSQISLLNMWLLVQICFQLLWDLESHALKPYKTKVPLIQKPVNWFSAQVSWLVFQWMGHCYWNGLVTWRIDKFYTTFVLDYQISNLYLIYAKVAEN